MKYLAHISEDGRRAQTVRQHLNGTAELAAQFASEFGMGQIAYRCGLAHDIGKYSEAFQQRIRGDNLKVDHSTAGAIELMDLRDVPSAFCVSGHHAGLPDGGSKVDVAENNTFFAKLKRKPGRPCGVEPYDAYKKEILLPEITEQPARIFMNDKMSAFFSVRMLYSCLVDADYLDTENFMTDGGRNRGKYATIRELDEKLTKHFAKYPRTGNLLNRKRTEIREALISGGELEKGLFSITVPTGGGKTLSSVSFALKHALKHNMKRIIYVIPYCSIIEQTQKVFADIFGEENVVAHYTGVDYGTSDEETEKDKRYLAAENWDAPVILTTSVQFFESLYGNRSSVCRKLHNIPNSIIIFDEAQMMPVPYMKPCISAISLLVEQYGCSTVLCTATQPSLDRLFAEFAPNKPVRELYYKRPDDDTIFRRVNYQYDGMLTDDELCDLLKDQSQVLCIVNNRKQAQQLFACLPEEGSFCLTTALYPKHRRNFLEEIRTRLRDGKACRVISTSLIEAGVDVDFPIVYRAIAGLDSIIQSGGRCNREGKKAAKDSIVHIFDTNADVSGILRQNIAATRRNLDKYKEEITSEASIKEYFDFLLYTLKGDENLDVKNILGRIRNETLPFAVVAKEFHLIESPTQTVYVLNQDEEGKQLAQALSRKAFTRELWRKLGQYAVSVYPQNWYMLENCGAIQKLTVDSAVLVSNDLYNMKTGLSLQPQSGGLLEL